MSASEDRRQSQAANLLAAALAIALGAYALAGTRGMSELGSVFPTTAAIVAILGGAVLALRSFLSAREDGGQRSRWAWRRWLGLVVTLVAWALLLRPLGFLATSALGMIAVALCAYREALSSRSIFLHVVAGSSLLLAFYALLKFVLRVPLP